METSSGESDIVVMEERVSVIRKRGSAKEQVPPPKIMRTEDREADKEDDRQPLTEDEITGTMEISG